MGFKEDVRQKADEFAGDLRELASRVGTLESQVRNLARATERPVERDVTGTAVRRDQPEATATRSGVDYGAVAFGLADMRRKLSQHLPSHQASSEMRGAVDWFAAAFAGDPSFDRDDFVAKANG